MAIRNSSLIPEVLVKVLSPLEYSHCLLGRQGMEKPFMLKLNVPNRSPDMRPLQFAMLPSVLIYAWAHTTGLVTVVLGAIDGLLIHNYAKSSLVHGAVNVQVIVQKRSIFDDSQFVTERQAVFVFESVER